MTVTKENKSFKAILKSAKALFWKYGIRKVTVEEICKEANVSKMTFYRNFDNKQEVAKTVLDRIAANSMKQYRSIMDQDVAFAEKVRQLVELEYQESDGISQEFLDDIYRSKDKKLAAQLEAYREASLKEIMKDFEVAQKKGWIRKDLKLSFVLYMLNSLHDKMMDDDFISMYKSPIEAIMEVTNFFFYGILPKNQNDSSKV